MSVKSPNPKWPQRPIRAKLVIIINQWKFKVKTRGLPKARENAGDQVVIVDFNFQSDWLRKWTEFFGTITERSTEKQKQPWITFNFQLHVAFFELFW